MQMTTILIKYQNRYTFYLKKEYYFLIFINNIDNKFTNYTSSYIFFEIIRCLQEIQQVIYSILPDTLVVIITMK